MFRIFIAIITVVAFTPAYSFTSIAHAACNHPNDRDSAGRRCGGRAASVIPGGKLGGDGRYQDSKGRDRIYGKNNDPYDSPSRSTLGKPYNNNLDNNSGSFRKENKRW